MATKISDLIGQSPTRELTEPEFTEFVLAAKSLGTSPPTFGSYIVQLQHLIRPRPQIETASRTLVLADQYKILYAEISGSPLADIEFEIPLNASVPFTEGTLINFVLKENGGASPANSMIVTAATGVFLNGTSGNSVSTSQNFAAGSLQKVGTDEWVLVGAMT